MIVCVWAVNSLVDNVIDIKVASMLYLTHCEEFAEKNIDGRMRGVCCVWRADFVFVLMSDYVMNFVNLVLTLWLLY